MGSTGRTCLPSLSLVADLGAGDHDLQRPGLARAREALVRVEEVVETEPVCDERPTSTESQVVVRDARGLRRHERSALATHYRLRAGRPRCDPRRATAAGALTCAASVGSSIVGRRDPRPDHGHPGSIQKVGFDADLAERVDEIEEMRVGGFDPGGSTEDECDVPGSLLDLRLQVPAECLPIRRKYVR